MLQQAFSHQNSKGIRYYLHRKSVTLRNRVQTIHFFAKKISTDFNKATPLGSVPAGFEITESARSGLPVLRRIVVAA